MNTQLSVNVSSRNFLRRSAELRLDYVVHLTKCKFDLCSIHFYNPVDNVSGYDMYPILTCGARVTSWSHPSIRSSTIMSVIRLLECNNFFGYCRTSSGSYIMIKPKIK